MNTQATRADIGSTPKFTRISNWEHFRKGISSYLGVGIGMLLVCTYLALTQPAFLTWPNIENILRTQAVILILAWGMSFVVLTGGIDLSVASTMALAASVFGILLGNGWSAPAAGLVTLGVGAGLGFFNGVLISKLKIPFFVVTLGTMSVFSSLALVLTNGQTRTLYATPEFAIIGQIVNGRIGPVPTLILLVALLYILGAFILRRTWFGRSVYSTGSNMEAARLSGINVTRTICLVYVIAGLAAGLASIVITGRLTAASPQLDPNLMLTVVAAVLIGGASFSGGEGGLLGTALGALFLGIVQNALSLSNVSTFWQGAVSGSILVIAVAIGLIRRPSWARSLSSST